jgi:hypothetical protein
MKSAPHSRQHHDLYAKYHYQDSEIRDLRGEYGLMMVASVIPMRQIKIPRTAI